MRRTIHLKDLLSQVSKGLLDGQSETTNYAGFELTSITLEVPYDLHPKEKGTHGSIVLESGDDADVANLPKLCIQFRPIRNPDPMQQRTDGSHDPFSGPMYEESGG